MTTITKTAEKTILPDTWQGETRALLTLGIPMALTQLAQFFIYTIDVLMIGRLGPEDLAAASLGSVIYFALWMLGSGAVMVVSPMVSQALGANKRDYHDVRISVRMSLWTIFMMVPVLFLLISFTEPIALALGQDPGVSRKASQYVLALAAGWPFALAVMSLRNFLAALEKTFVPFLLVMTTTVLNAFLNYLLIYGNFGLPRLELVGAGIASSLSYMLSFGFFILYILQQKEARKFRVFQRFWRPHWNRFREIFRLGWPISMATVFEGMLFNAAVILMGLIGVMEMAAYQIALNVVALAFMLPWGLSMAGAVRVGLAEGAENKPAVKRVSIITIIAAVTSIGMIALPVSVFPDLIASLYLEADKVDNAGVIALVVSFLPVAGAFMLFDAAQVAANQLLRGLKDVRWPMILTGISYWVIGFPIAAYLAFATNFGALGVWFGLMGGLLAATLLLGTRLWWIVWRHPTHP